jgi:GTP-binding protein HflX
LLAVLDERLAAALETVTYAIPAADGARLAWLYRHGEVIERAEGESGTRLTVRLTSVDRARFEQPSDD